MNSHNKLYIFIPDWENTSGNHAGMYYLARQIARRIPACVKVVKLPTRNLYLFFWIYRIYLDLIAMLLRLKLRKGDAVWLMEYYLRSIQQSDAARILSGKAKILATAHLCPGRIRKHYSPATICRKAKHLDRLYTLGSSLRDFYVEQGIPADKVLTSFHYVDTEFYHPVPHTPGKRIKAIAMGNMERDDVLMRRIIELTPEVDFIICTGMRKNHNFHNLPNVEIHGYIPEEELRRLMQTADVSINPMFDTVGSNVITTSLACGLPVVATDVGSIRDYVADGHSGLLFADAADAADKLRSLDADRALLAEMGKNARRKAEEISIDRYIDHLMADIDSL